MKNRRLSPKEIDGFCFAYPDTTDQVLCEIYGFDRQHVAYLAKKYRLKKSENFWHLSRQYAAEKSHEVRKRNKQKKPAGAKKQL